MGWVKAGPAQPSRVGLKGGPTNPYSSFGGVGGEVDPTHPYGLGQNGSSHDTHGYWPDPTMQTEQWFCIQITMVFHQNREEKRDA